MSTFHFAKPVRLSPLRVRHVDGR